MTQSSNLLPISGTQSSESGRLFYLDATRAFALILGIVFHASLSFMPMYMGWAVQDVSTSALVKVFMTVSHCFRMETFFLLAGFFSYVTFHRKGAWEFVRSRAIRIVAPFVVGWFILRPLLVSGWIMGFASLHGKVDVRAGLAGGFQSLSTLPSGIFTGSHLWFLYYLAMVTTLALAVRGLTRANSVCRAKLVQWADTYTASLANSRFSLLILGFQTALILWFMRSWGMDTPDQSLVPHVPALTIYGGFFGLGWMLGRQRELLSRLARLTPDRWIFAVLGILGITLLGDIERNPAHVHYRAAHVAYALSYGIAMWGLVFLTIGIFKKLCSKPNDFVRYVAESSYWMYLIHLPIIIWLQIAVAELPLHWTFKLAFVSATTIAISLVTYELFVRATIIGWVLNGRRRNRMVAAIPGAPLRRHPASGAPLP